MQASLWGQGRPHPQSYFQAAKVPATAAQPDCSLPTELHGAAANTQLSPLACSMPAVLSCSKRV